MKIRMESEMEHEMEFTGLDFGSLVVRAFALGFVVSGVRV